MKMWWLTIHLASYFVSVVVRFVIILFYIILMLRKSHSHIWSGYICWFEMRIYTVFRNSHVRANTKQKSVACYFFFFNGNERDDNWLICRYRSGRFEIYDQKSRMSRRKNEPRTNSMKLYDGKVKHCNTLSTCIMTVVDVGKFNGSYRIYHLYSLLLFLCCCFFSLLSSSPSS